MKTFEDACSLQASTNRDRDLLMWAIYDNPSDFPGKFVARPVSLFHSTPEKLAFLDFVLVADSLAEIRKMLPPGLTNLGADSRDEPHIVETWT